MKNKFTPELKQKIKEIVEHIGNDGHTIWKESVIKGLPKGLRDRFVTEIKSDYTSYKSTIFDKNGKPVPSIKGFYGLNVLQAICNDLNLDYEGKIGRGFQAQVCTEAINKWLEA